MRQRVSIIAIASLVLVAIIMVAVLGSIHGFKYDNYSSPDTTFSSSIKPVCDATDSCPIVINSTDPINLFHLSVQDAKNELLTVYKRFEALGIEGAISSWSLAALSNCDELIGLAVDHLDDCVTTDISSKEIVDDLKTWLSAAITYQHTCIDGFANSTIELRNRVTESLSSSTEFTSNSLTILTKIGNDVDPVKLRRLMSQYSDGWPSWLTSTHRRLLESSDHPRNDIANAIVAKDGSGKYNTINEAISAVPVKNNNRFVIYVKKGIYYENVKVENDKWNVMIVGDGMDTTIVTGGLNYFEGTLTYNSATFAVFGQGFIAQDMGFQNSAGPAKHQAVAMMSNSDRSIFHRCKFDAYQDTLYAHANRQFYRDCKIYGTVDFIFGNAAAVFQACKILPRVPMPGQQDTITAQGKAGPNLTSGFSIHNCTIQPFGDLKSVKVYLGRPWKPYSTTVFMRTMMSEVIDPAGWLAWTGSSTPDTIFYSEYNNYGPGSVTKNRVKWKGVRTMSSQQAASFTVGEFLQGSSWIPTTDVPFYAGL